MAATVAWEHFYTTWLDEPGPEAEMVFIPENQPPTHKLAKILHDTFWETYSRVFDADYPFGIDTQLLGDTGALPYGVAFDLEMGEEQGPDMLAAWSQTLTAQGISGRFDYYWYAEGEDSYGWGEAGEVEPKTTGTYTAYCYPKPTPGNAADAPRDTIQLRDRALAYLESGPDVPAWVLLTAGLARSENVQDLIPWIPPSQDNLSWSIHPGNQPSPTARAIAGRSGKHVEFCCGEVNFGYHEALPILTRALVEAAALMEYGLVHLARGGSGLNFRYGVPESAYFPGRQDLRRGPSTPGLIDASGTMIVPADWLERCPDLSLWHCTDTEDNKVLLEAQDADAWYGTACTPDAEVLTAARDALSPIINRDLDH